MEFLESENIPWKLDRIIFVMIEQGRIVKAYADKRKAVEHYKRNNYKYGHGNISPIVIKMVQSTKPDITKDEVPIWIVLQLDLDGNHPIIVKGFNSKETAENTVVRFKEMTVNSPRDFKIVQVPLEEDNAIHGNPPDYDIKRMGFDIS